ncbi:MAG: flagellar assembly protein A [Alkalispirochaetaceae bacterium]
MPREELNVTGVLKLDIPENATYVDLIITPDESEGDSWNVDKLVELLEERGIKADINREKIGAALKEITSKDQPGGGVRIVEGTAPRPPRPEEVAWEDLEVPEEVAPYQERALNRADPPEIYRESKERIKKSRQVEKKGVFGKKETKSEEYYDTVVRRERVYIDPNVEEVGYAREGQRLGVVGEADSGAPGKDIYGRTVQPKRLSDIRFYPGPGTNRKGAELFCERDGFVRIGRNWVDVVPFAFHEWELTRSRDKATCLFSFKPGSPALPPPEASEVIATAEKQGHDPATLVPEDEIAALIAQAVEGSSELEQVPLSRSRDASFDIFVSEDRLTAVLNLHKGKGKGKPLLLKEVGKAIKESGLKGLDYDRIRTDVKEFYEGDETDLVGYLLAEGREPVTGPEREVEWGVRFMSEKELEKQREELVSHPDRLAGLLSLGEYPLSTVTMMGSVHKEQMIVTVSPPVGGEPGVDVYGKELPAPAAPAPRFRCFEHVEEKQGVYVAMRAGILDRADLEGVTYLRVRPHNDATVEVTITEEGMAAHLTLREGHGSGRRLSREMVEGAITRAGVTHGVDQEVIARALEVAMDGEAVEGVVFARGRAPRKGDESELELLVDISRNSGVTIRSDGRADYRNRNAITAVEAGQRIARIRPPEAEPEDGYDVTGKTITVGVEKTLDLDVGEKIRREEQEDGSILLVAETAGEVLYDEKKSSIALRTVHTVDGDIDYGEGNVTFPGSVLIKGNVRNGFVVMSEGDISVGENVEGALLSSAGTVTVKQGVKGQGKAVLRAKGEVRSGFIERATVLSVQDVKVKSAILTCRVKCNGTVRLPKDRSRIVGGEVRSRHGIVVHTLGSDKGTATKVSFGQDYLVMDLIEKEEREIEKVKKRLTAVDFEMRRSEKVGKHELLERLRKEKVRLMKVLEKRGLRLFSLREKFETHYPSQINIHGTLYPGVVFESHGRTLEVVQQKKAVTVAFNQQTGHIEVVPIESDAKE